MRLLLAGLRRHRDCLHVPGRVARPCRWCRNPRRGVVLQFPQKAAGAIAPTRQASDPSA